MSDCEDLFDDYLGLLELLLQREGEKITQGPRGRDKGIGVGHNGARHTLKSVSARRGPHEQVSRGREVGARKIGREGSG
jgi:hypothetical protein